MQPECLADRRRSSSAARKSTLLLVRCSPGHGIRRQPPLRLPASANPTWSGASSSPRSMTGAPRAISTKPPAFLR
ncbi:MAG: hypothetical protein MZW92_00540 [Comamonadaceae bacterium]|nr:hypothetical protein [Comamonadaceae bacterium]